MNEFLKLNWEFDAIAAAEAKICFIKDEFFPSCRIFKSVEEIKAELGDPDEEPGCSNGKKEKAAVKYTHYIPGIKLSETGKKSQLNGHLQKQCLGALKILQSGRPYAKLNVQEQFLVEVYGKHKTLILEENQLFQKYVQNFWNTKPRFYWRSNDYFIRFMKARWEINCKRYFDYSRYYKEKKLFSMSYVENESEILYNAVQNVLEVGSLAKYSQPTLIIKVSLNLKNFPSEDAKYSSQLPVSFDKNMDEILNTHKIDLVISESGLKRLSDMSDLKSKWQIPVIVKRIGDKKVVFVDKPLPNLKINHYDLEKSGCKKLLKTVCCFIKKITFPAEDKKIDTNEEAPDNQEDDQEQVKGFQHEIHHNVNYRIWNIKKIGEQNNLMKNKSEYEEINVLVRSKVDACQMNDQGNLIPIIVRPIFERQCNFGANIATKSELYHEWTSLFFKPFSLLYRARLCLPNHELVSFEKCSLAKVANEALVYYQQKPNLGLGVLQKVFKELMQLDVGEYLLQHLPKHEAFVSVLQKIDQPDEKCFDLHANVNVEVDPQLPDSFVPIDVNYILPEHLYRERLPGTFSPPEFKKWNKDNKGKNKNKKKKKKTSKLKESDAKDTEKPE